MSAIQSYLRHLLVTGVMFLVDKAGLPVEGASAAVEALATAIAGTATWYVVKFVTPFLKSNNTPES